MRKIATLASVVLCSLLKVAPLWAETVEIPGVYLPPSLVPEAKPVPRLLFEAGALEPAARLAAARLAATTEVEAIAGWNAGGRQPQKAGFVRPLDRPLRVELGAVAGRSFHGPESHGLLQVSPEGLVWATRVEVDESSRLRLRLESVDLPADVEMLVYNESGEAVRFGLELRDADGGVWTPSIAGPVAFLEVRGGPAFSAGRLEITAVAEEFELDEEGRPLPGIDPKVITSCLIASACVPTGVFSNIAVLQGAVAHIRYIKDGGTYVCSGGLLNDRDDSGFVPYFLTANHCFSNQGSASSLEAFWDYRESSCGGPVPNLANLPRSNGSTLLATSSSSDFTFLRLNGIPGGRYLLGWTTAVPPGGSSAYSVHHPYGWQQAYSRTVVAGSPARFCNGLAPVRFLYTNRADGTSMPGSSGAPLTNANGHVIGQLFGGCADDTGEPCLFDGNDYVVYGRFAETYPSISSWLSQTSGTPGTPCADNATTLCLLNNRFKVVATYRTSSGQTGAAKAVRLTQETGYFWFFNQTNIETVFKLLNGCGLNSRYWVFAGGLTDVEVTTTITDTASGITRTFYNPLGTPFQPIADTSAFATCP